ncbi:ATP-binding protein [Candidatus Poribacteria bacterium]|nr:ATP-binding protein [Candidatus Poribacteria bacterium]
MVLGHDIKTQLPVEVSLDKSRVIFVTGKRGSGKSYTLGVLAEELYLQGSVAEIKPLVSTGSTRRILMVDPLGIFFTFCCPNPERTAGETPLPPVHGGDRRDALGSPPRAGGVALPVRLLVPGDPATRYGEDVVERMETLGVCFQALRLNPSGLSPSEWCDLFGLSINEPLGIALFRAVQHLASAFFSVPQLIERVWEDPRSADKTKEALVNRLEMAHGWDIFSQAETDLEETLDTESINVLDLSVLAPGAYGLANLIVSVICRTLFQQRVQSKRRENLCLAPTAERIWLLIDEAQRFVPAGRNTLSKDILIAWAKEGRQPGLSVAFATQQPSAIDNDILSQCDLSVCHRLSNQEDIAAVNKLSQDYLGSELKTYVRQLKNQGEALLLDDFTERLSLCRVKPRRTLHGGGESRLPLFQ